LTACKQHKADKVEERKQPVAFFDPMELGSTNQTSNLKIEARFDECGEWGGHKEEIIISSDKKENIYATYNIYPFNCDSLDYYYSKRDLTPISSTTILLTDKTKKSIVDYIHRLTQSKISERFPGHAGNLFSLVNTDSSLNIQVYDNKDFDVKSFRQLIAELTN
jgi:hypothetical protein